MSTAIEKARDAAELSRAGGQEAWRFAQALSTAGMLPKEYRDKPGNVLLAMEYGRALALPVATILTSVHVIDGRPSMSAELMQALIRRAGHRIRITGDGRSASCAIVRKDEPGPRRSLVLHRVRSCRANVPQRPDLERMPAYPRMSARSEETP